MSTAKKTPRKRRRRRTTLSAPAPRRRTTRRRRTRRTRARGLSSGGSTSRKPTLMGSLKTGGAGGLGGIAYSAPQFLFKMKTWQKLVYGGVTTLAACYAKAPQVGAGIAGATAYDMIRIMTGPMLKDDLQDVEYVDPNTLSDTGLQDDGGNDIVMDDDGNAYVLNDNGDYEMIGDAEYLENAFDLQDAYDLQDDLQSVSMVPLADPYSLQQQMGAGNPYALASNY